MRICTALLCLAMGAAHAAPATESRAVLEQQVRATETAFAKTMAKRDLAAFRSFLAPDAVFVAQPIARGPAEIVAAWRELFSAARAPFSWAPETVAVLASARLAQSTGPVLAPDGRRVGTFASVWRRERDGRWRIVLDYGCPQCRCPSAPPASPAPP